METLSVSHQQAADCGVHEHPPSFLHKGGLAIAASASPAPAAAALPVAAAVSVDRMTKFTLDPQEPRRDMQRLVQDLMQELAEGKEKDLNKLYNIMMSYDYAGNEWKRFEFWDDKKKYTRNLIASVPGQFALMLLCWNPSKASPIHAHAGSECFARVLSGQLVETQYVVRNGEGDLSAQASWNQLTSAQVAASDLVKSHEKRCEAGMCTFINDSLGVHAMANQSAVGAVSLHCYIPEYSCCKIWQCPDAATAASASPATAAAIAACKADELLVTKSYISFDTEQGERTHE